MKLYAIYSGYNSSMEPASITSIWTTEIGAKDQLLEEATHMKLKHYSEIFTRAKYKPELGTHYTDGDHDLYIAVIYADKDYMESPPEDTEANVLD